MKTFQLLFSAATLSALSALILSACTPMDAQDTGGVVISQSQHLALSDAHYSAWLQGRGDDELEFMAQGRDHLLDRVLDHHSDEVLLERAREVGLDRDPLIAAKMRDSSNRILIAALMAKTARDTVVNEVPALAKESYLANLDAHRTKERRKVAHILLRKSAACACDPSPEPGELATEILEKLSNGADFATLAQEFSKDSASAKNGGTIEKWILRDGETLKPFEDAVFSIAAVGDVSEPVKTSYGLHLIKLLELDSSRQLTFEEVQSEIEKQVLAKAQASAQEQMRSVAYPDPDTLNFDVLENFVKQEFERRAAAK